VSPGEGHEVATLGGGCFWCHQPIFQEVRGVEKVVVGYSGGHVKNPTYEEVCTGTTDHAEVFQVTFDPDVVSFEELLKVFFSVHDPTTLNRQGNDVGTQYRSIVLYANEQQKLEAERFIKELDDSQSHSDPVVTEVKPLGEFYAAEDYHRKYYANNPYQPYCQALIPPKLRKVHKQFAELLKSHGKGN